MSSDTVARPVSCALGAADLTQVADQAGCILRCNQQGTEKLKAEPQVTKRLGKDHLALELRAGGSGRIRNAAMACGWRAWPDRADLPGDILTNGDHQAELRRSVLRELVPAFRAQVLRRILKGLQHFECRRVDVWHRLHFITDLEGQPGRHVQRDMVSFLDDGPGEPGLRVAPTIQRAKLSGPDLSDLTDGPASPPL